MSRSLHLLLRVLLLALALPAAAAAQDPACELPIDVGPCEAVVPRWAYDVDIGACVQFTWGGCGGNANNYLTQVECESACLAPCEQPIDVGPCDAAIPRWAYDADIGECVQFTWGGCAPNANNYLTQLDCEEACARAVPVEPATWGNIKLLYGAADPGRH